MCGTAGAVPIRLLYRFDLFKNFLEVREGMGRGVPEIPFSPSPR